MFVMTGGMALTNRCQQRAAKSDMQRYLMVRMRWPTKAMPTAQQIVLKRPRYCGDACQRGRGCHHHVRQMHLVGNYGAWNRHEIDPEGLS